MKYLWPAQNNNLNYISSPPSEQWIAEKHNLVILGSTGSIGKNALRVVEAQPQLFSIQGLAGANNIQELAKQAMQWTPPYLGVLTNAGAEQLRKLLPSDYNPKILVGDAGYMELASLDCANTVLSAQVGAAGLRGTVAAAMAGKVVALANKESLVLAGALLRKICAKTKASILPVDSEHNALFQALAGRSAEHVKKLILTASGGPFRKYSLEDLQNVTLAQALKHPNWSMGAKITIDSATLMNKGLEVMEAYQLYGVDLEHIGVLVHPQSIVHSLVEYMDNSLIAHLGSPDMRMAIAQCLAWPHCVDSGVKPLDLLTCGDLTFHEPDLSSFPCLALARRVLQENTEKTCGFNGQAVVLNAANEVAVDLFLHEKISFMDIPKLIENALNFNIYAKYMNNVLDDDLCPEYVNKVLEIIMNIDNETRHYAQGLVGK